MLLEYKDSVSEDYRTEDLLSFYARDPHSVSERSSPQGITKALLYNGRTPAVLTIQFNQQQFSAQLQFSSHEPSVSATQFQAWIKHLTGLDQNIDEFEQRFSTQPDIGTIIQQQRGLRIIPTASVFEAISWAILGQQISVAAALSLRRKLIQITNIQLPCGLYCYPAAEQVARLSVAQLRNIGLSETKAFALLRVSELIAQGKINTLRCTSPEEAQRFMQQLTAIKGIGPWTAHYSLMRGHGWLDSSVEGDGAIQRHLATLLNKERITAKEAYTWLAQFSPWRSLVAAHLWHSAGIRA